MKPFTALLARRPSPSRAVVCAAAAALALASCMDRVAGTSVGTGNPTEIQVGFKDGTGPVALTGTLDVYASTQIPVPGYAPKPLLSYPLSHAGSGVLPAGDFAALPDSLWAKGSIQGDIRAFNLVVTGESRGSLLKGFGFDKARGVFIPRPEDSAAERDAAGRAVILSDSLKSLIAIGGTVDTTTLSGSKDYHLFLYGTGFESKVEKGTFTLSGVPDGKYEAFLLALPQKDHPYSGTDSTEVFSTSMSVSPGTASLSRGDLHDRVRLPDSLIAR